jgi:hypothetical protein
MIKSYLAYFRPMWYQSEMCLCVLFTKYGCQKPNQLIVSLFLLGYFCEYFCEQRVCWHHLPTITILKEWSQWKGSLRTVRGPSKLLEIRGLNVQNLSSHSGTVASNSGSHGIIYIQIKWRYYAKKDEFVCSFIWINSFPHIFNSKS